MNAKLFSEALSEVSDKYYEEAANYHCKKHGWIKWGALATCLCMVIFGAVLFSMRDQNNAPAASRYDGYPYDDCEVLDYIESTLPICRQTPEQFILTKSPTLMRIENSIPFPDMKASPITLRARPPMIF